MKKWLKKRKSGFTLVELLIVVIIIGILAGALLLVAGSSTDKAAATKIVSDARSIKGGALLYYTDQNIWPASSVDVRDYVDRALDTTYADFSIASADNGTYISVQVDLTDKADGGIIDKLVDIDSGFVTSISGDTEIDTTTALNTFYLRIK